MRQILGAVPKARRRGFRTVALIVSALTFTILCGVDAMAQPMNMEEPEKAQPKDAKPETATAKSPSAAECRASETPVGQKEALYQQFECHFSRGQYSAGLPFLEKACSMTDSPRCLLNLGAVHHALMHCELARAYYERYLDRVPYEQASDDARGALAELETACPRPFSSSVPATDATDENSAPVLEPGSGTGVQDRVSPVAASQSHGPLRPKSASGAVDDPAQRGDGSIRDSDLDEASRGGVQSTQRIAAWSLLGAGAATALATLVVAGYGYRAERDAEARHRDTGRGIEDDAELRAIDHRGQQYNDLAIALGLVSGALLGSGTALWFLEVNPGPSESDTDSGAVYLQYRGAF